MLASLHPAIPNHTKRWALFISSDTQFFLRPSLLQTRPLVSCICFLCPRPHCPCCAVSSSANTSSTPHRFPWIAGFFRQGRQCDLCDSALSTNRIPTYPLATGLHLQGAAPASQMRHRGIRCLIVSQVMLRCSL